MNLGSTYTDAGATADGGETVTTSGSVDVILLVLIQSPTQLLMLQAILGTATRTVTVVDTTAPVISVTSGTDTVELGATWTDAGATADGGETVINFGSVDTQLVGTYTLLTQLLMLQAILVLLLELLQSLIQLLLLLQLSEITQLQ